MRKAVLFFLSLCMFCANASATPSSAEQKRARAREKTVVKEEIQRILRKQIYLSYLEDLTQSNHLPVDLPTFARYYASTTNYHSISSSFLLKQVFSLLYTKFTSDTSKIGYVAEKTISLKTSLFINPKSGTSIDLLNLLATHDDHEYIKLEIKNLATSDEASLQRLKRHLYKIKRSFPYSYQGRIKTTSTPINMHPNSPLMFSSTAYFYLPKKYFPQNARRALARLIEDFIPLNNDLIKEIRRSRKAIKADKMQSIKKRLIQCKKLL